VNLPDHVSYADFLAYAEAHDGTFEFVDGHVLDMGIPSDAHQTLVLAIGAELRAALAGTRCSAIINPRLRTRPRRERSPDVLVRCAPAAGSLYEPRVVIEILSPNRGDDQSAKITEYQALLSIAEYVMIDSTRRWARRYVRNERGMFDYATDIIGGVVILEAIDCALDLDRLYEEAGVM
jgi:Uma2 family endonuclease